MLSRETQCLVFKTYLVLAPSNAMSSSHLQEALEREHLEAQRGMLLLSSQQLCFLVHQIEEQ